MVLIFTVGLRGGNRLIHRGRRRLFSWRADVEKIVKQGGLPIAHAPVGEHTPPLAIRSLLVGSATALATPLFPVIGFNFFAKRFLDPVQRMAITGGGSVLVYSAMTLLPNAFYYAPLLLPFAVGNGVTAAGLYIASDVAAGGPHNLADLKLGGVPVFGSAIGVATAFAAPFTYPAAWTLVWPESGAGQHVMDGDLYNAIFQVCINNEFMPFILGATGATAGALIHAG